MVIEVCQLSFSLPPDKDSVDSSRRFEFNQQKCRCATSTVGLSTACDMNPISEVFQGYQLQYAHWMIVSSYWQYQSQRRHRKMRWRSVFDIFVRVRWNFRQIIVAKVENVVQLHSVLYFTVTVGTRRVVELFIPEQPSAWKYLFSIDNCLSCWSEWIVPYTSISRATRHCK